MFVEFLNGVCCCKPMIGPEVVMNPLPNRHLTNLNDSVQSVISKHSSASELIEMVASSDQLHNISDLLKIIFQEKNRLDIGPNSFLIVMSDFNLLGQIFRFGEHGDTHLSAFVDIFQNMIFHWFETEASHKLKPDGVGSDLVMSFERNNIKHLIICDFIDFTDGTRELIGHYEMNFSTHNRYTQIADLFFKNQKHLTYALESDLLRIDGQDDVTYYKLKPTKHGSHDAAYAHSDKYPFRNLQINLPIVEVEKKISTTALLQYQC